MTQLESALTDCLRIFAERGRKIREEAQQEAASLPNVCEAQPEPAADDAAANDHDAKASIT